MMTFSPGFFTLLAASVLGFLLLLGFGAALQSSLGSLPDMAALGYVVLLAVSLIARFLGKPWSRRLLQGLLVVGAGAYVIFAIWMLSGPIAR